MDGLNFEGSWVGLNESDPEKLKRKFREAIEVEKWVVSGSYTKFSQEIIWPNADTIIWLDFPKYLLIFRMLRRSWKRWRTKELLWGTNQEKFCRNS